MLTCAHVQYVPTSEDVHLIVVEPTDFAIGVPAAMKIKIF